jgi:copper chaperone CopZ
MPDSTPLQFNVPDMDCGACVKSITEAVHRVDAAASVSADPETKRVVIGGDHRSEEYVAAIEEAGFTVQAAE